MSTDETVACMLVGEHAFVMLLSREKFAEFPIADPTTHTLALYCFSVSFGRQTRHGIHAGLLITAAAVLIVANLVEPLRNRLRRQRDRLGRLRTGGDRGLPSAGGHRSEHRDHDFGDRRAELLDVVRQR